jgi:hypothetical protein
MKYLILTLTLFFISTSGYISFFDTRGGTAFLFTKDVKIGQVTGNIVVCSYTSGLSSLINPPLGTKSFPFIIVYDKYMNYQWSKYYNYYPTHYQSFDRCNFSPDDSLISAILFAAVSG